MDDMYLELNNSLDDNGVPVPEYGQLVGEPPIQWNEVSGAAYYNVVITPDNAPVDVAWMKTNITGTHTYITADGYRTLFYDEEDYDIEVIAYDAGDNELESCGVNFIAIADDILE